MLKEPSSPSLISIVCALGLAALVLGYTVAVVTRKIERIDTTNLAIIVVGVLCIAALLKPRMFDRLQSLEVSGIKLRMLEQQQQQQQSKLDEFSLILPILLHDTERKHLINLAHQNSAEYIGNHQMRTELRRLRSIGLIRSRVGRGIGEMKDGSQFDLADFVALTPLGQHWVERIDSIESAESKEPKESEES